MPSGKIPRDAECSICREVRAEHSKVLALCPPIIVEHPNGSRQLMPPWPRGAFWVRAAA